MLTTTKTKNVSPLNKNHPCCKSYLSHLTGMHVLLPDLMQTFHVGRAPPMFNLLISPLLVFRHMMSRTTYIVHLKITNYLILNVMYLKNREEVHRNPKLITHTKERRLLLLQKSHSLQGKIKGGRSNRVAMKIRSIVK